MSTLEPWWKRVQDAAELLASNLNAAVDRAGRNGVYTPPPEAPAPRRRRRPASLRHLAEVIRVQRLAPGVAVDKDIVARVLSGDHKYLADPLVVVAVARAAHHIAGTAFADADGQRLTVAVTRFNTLIEAAREADRQAPMLLPVPRAGSTLLPSPDQAQEPADRGEPGGPTIIDAEFTTRPLRRRRVQALWAGLAVGALAAASVAAVLAMDNPDQKRPALATADADCRDGATGDDVILDTTTVFDDDQATRLSPTLDFDAMNGSARYATHLGRTYYWGRAGSDDNRPHSGGSRTRWRIGNGPWHSCATALPLIERGYVHSPAVATTVADQAVTVQVCLWRDEPRRENCTPQISTG